MRQFFKPHHSAARLKAAADSGSLSYGLQLHAHLIKYGLDSHRLVGDSLLSLYFKLCPDVSATRRVFDGLPVKDVVSWTSMVSGYSRTGRPLDSLRMFVKMSTFGGVEPNDFTLSAAVKASSDLEDVRLGRCLHAMVFPRGFETNHVIASALVYMYGRSYAIEDARRVFDELLEPDSVCWTSIVSVLTWNDEFAEALRFFRLMTSNSLRVLPDEFTFGTIMKALGNLGRQKQGKEVHAKILTNGLRGNVVVESSTLDMYAKCGLMGDARKVFDQMPKRNAVSWCALLGGYCEAKNYEAVLSLFRAMDKEDDEQYSYGTILRACAGLAAVRHGKEVHCRYLRISRCRYVIVESALIDLYAKCGLVDYAYRLFAKISARNLITWNTMISGFAQNGRGSHAIELFEEMLKQGMRPDYISFVGLLFACSHSGLVDEGRRHFRSMSQDYNIVPGTEHYTCMVDLLSRVGLLEEAEELINDSKCRGESSLRATLLGACATHARVDVAERVARRMMKLEPEQHLSYVLLGNVYKTVGRWNEALQIRKMMRKRGVRKAPGRSWIEANPITCRDTEESEDQIPHAVNIS
ncbi:pentatricopeptide repeat-containing protein At1g03540-like [Zingiber officinale]|uniref:Pentatricopeptide repeat-containing protein n=1 Tax=Zingiber officinale TaxID=94328 RepID=A0A8J5L7V4_ZINOF|nr:pentatricopeptide repeat-containing protein At1g03540-like [Zingiber officinale]KAG6516871.1 hypothetical protein ZIOFF_020244 [Zingiber officinale]